MDTPVLKVVVDRPFRTALDYLPPVPALDAAACVSGVRVSVPMGRGRCIGVVVGRADASSLPTEKLKPVQAVLDATPLLDASLLELLLWCADYYHHPVGEVVFGALPALLRGGASATGREEFLQLLPAGTAALAAGAAARAPRQRELLQALHEGGGLLGTGALVAWHADWRVAARALKLRGWAVSGERESAMAIVGNAVASATAGAAANDPAALLRGAAPVLTTEQNAAITAVNEHAGRFASLVLQGVTGSGKTEVYLHAVAGALARGQSALVLVPEIGLTPQLVERFRARFSLPIAVLHSGMSDGERLLQWRAAWQRNARIVVGTRSAVFAPLAGLGLIVVDEEHDTSFKQQEGGCRYSARDLAVRRAQLARIPVVLGSATPSLETLHNIARGRYQRLLLPRRDDQAPAPSLSLIDLRTQAVTAGISTAVLQAMEKHLAAGSQVLVYINRRGYAPTLMCTACGWIAPCHNCDARLTVYRQAARLRCHYCGADEALPERCQRCGHALKPVGQGTERVEDTLTELFPQQAIARLDRDAVRTQAALEAVMSAVRSGAARILVGTQMVTKGHDFPDVTLVAVLNADQGLFSTDFRAAERLAQGIVQVAGRAGRADKPGEVLVQTEFPEHPLLQSLLQSGYEFFAASALAERQAARWPPFSHLALLRASSPAALPALDFLNAARADADALQAAARGVQLLGPVAAAMARRADRHHAQLLIECAERGRLQEFLRSWVARVETLPEAARVRWALDVDPQETR
jgi:primosomal protein N' (replication factor Y) (superfamily II helicase)